MKKTGKIILRCALAAVLAAAAAVPVSAESYDYVVAHPEIYIGGDDAFDTDEVTETRAEEDSTYSAEEQEEVLKTIEEAKAANPRTETTGQITVILEEQPEDWDQANIEVTIYSGQYKETIFLYRQAGWEAMANLPEGKYTFYKAETLSKRNSFVSDLNTFYIDEKSPVTIHLTPEPEAETVIVPIEDVATSSEATASEKNTTDGSDFSALSVIKGIVIAIIVIAAFFFLSLFLKGTDDGPDDENNILD